jgi:uncharacterized protein
MRASQETIEAMAWSAYFADEFRLAFKLFLRLAMSGSGDAQVQVALMLDDGEGVRQDHALAAGWYRSAAMQGNAQAQHNLAVCYERGEGLDRDPSLAANWYRRAAQNGHASAQGQRGRR